eukprot:4423792-Pyramimonas_sp.AAC.1
MHRPGIGDTSPIDRRYAPGGEYARSWAGWGYRYRAHIGDQWAIWGRCIPPYAYPPYRCPWIRQDSPGKGGS